MSEILRNFTGRAIDDIALTEYLAGGSNTATFKTIVSGQSAVVKLFALDAAQADAQLAHWQRTEKFAHPHLLRTIKTGRGELDGTPVVYAVTEFAEENLAQVLPERALTPPEARQVLESTLDALAYLHAQGFAHSDLKPANIMAIGDQLKLSLDGVQRVGEPLIREPGQHDAPEAAQKLSPASDIWSLGMTLVEVLTQQLPPKPVSEAAGPAVPESVPAPFREIAQHCLLRTPELRWSVEEIAAKLNPKAPTRLESAAPARVAAPPPPVPPVRPKSRRPLILLAIVAAIVIVIVLLSRRAEHEDQFTSRAPVPASTESQTPAPQPAPASQAPATEAPAPETTPATSTKTARTESADQHISDEPAADNEGDNDTASVPGVVRQVMPKVSTRARNSIHGKVRVKVKVNVDASGNVVESSFISRGPSRYFANAADDAARRWKFAPSSTEARAWNLEFEFRRSGTQVRPRQAQ